MGKLFLKCGSYWVNSRLFAARPPPGYPLEKLENGGRKLGKRPDNPVWLQFPDRGLAVAEVDRHYWDAGGTGRIDIIDRIPDHDGLARSALDTLDGSPQGLRARFLQPEGVRAADRLEARR